VPGGREGICSADMIMIFLALKSAYQQIFFYYSETHFIWNPINSVTPLIRIIADFMKKYFWGLTAIVCALALSAFTKPFATLTLKLLTNPTAANIVNDPAQWSTCGTYSPPTITLNTSRSSYFHSAGSCKILNSLAYANALDPKQDYLIIVEEVGIIPYRIITSIQPMHYNPSTLQYESATLGSDLSYSN